MSKPYFRVIGDVHQQLKPYVEIAREAEYSLQVGDLGYNYELLKGLDPERHKVFGGNHDNYAKMGTSVYVHMQTGHWLGDFGVHTVPGFGDIFFVRGGRSIDWRYLVKGEKYFDEEELTKEEMAKALQLYIDTKPTHVFSHECPASIIDLAFGQKIWDGELLKPSRTSRLLDMMWNNHHPENWVFGHHHKDWSEEIQGTTFRCVPELGHFDFDKRS